jgi:hypothetical protein
MLPLGIKLTPASSTTLHDLPKNNQPNLDITPSLRMQFMYMLLQTTNRRAEHDLSSIHTHHTTSGMCRRCSWGSGSCLAHMCDFGVSPKAYHPPNNIEGMIRPTKPRTPLPRMQLFCMLRQTTNRQIGHDSFPIPTRQATLGVYPYSWGVLFLHCTLSWASLIAACPPHTLHTSGSMSRLEKLAQHYCSNDSSKQAMCRKQYCPKASTCDKEKLAQHYCSNDSSKQAICRKQYCPQASTSDKPRLPTNLGYIVSEYIPTHAWPSDCNNHAEC